MLTKKFLKTKNETDVTFEFEREDVSSVELFCDFNGWKAVEMKFNKKSQSFKIKLRLPIDGSYHFRYLLNHSEWENDAQADQYLPNDFGSDNSVVSTIN